MEDKSTTIKISKEIVRELAKLKVHRRQAYDEVISRLVGLYKKDDLKEVEIDVSSEEASTIKLSRPIVERISEMKVHRRQAYDEIIAGLVELYRKSNVIEEKEEVVFRKKSVTTVKIPKKAVQMLAALKVHPRQSYDEIIMGLLESYEGGFSGDGYYDVGEITTIKLSRDVVRRLSKLKTRPRQAHGEIILRLLSYKKDE